MQFFPLELPSLTGKGSESSSSCHHNLLVKQSKWYTTAMKSLSSVPTCLAESLLGERTPS